MTDERIKEEFEKFQDRRESNEELMFAIEVDPAIEWREEALGFYAGFRTAERLAKIEVLEEVRDNAERGHILAYIEKRIAELKEEGE
jgi:hypothetical protein